MKRPAPLEATSASSRVQAELAKLPELPDQLSYFDDFANETRSIAGIRCDTAWPLSSNGRMAKLDFAVFGPTAGELLRHWAVWQLTRGSTGTLRTYYWGNKRILEKHGPHVFLACLTASPMELKTLWHSEILPAHRTQLAVTGLKSLFQFAAAMSLGSLRPEHADFIGGFSLPTKDKYAALRAGGAFLSIDEESKLIDYLDGVAARAHLPDTSLLDLRQACVLACSYQHGVRPVQVARLRRAEVRVLPSSDSPDPTIRLTFWTAKKRWSASVRPMTRSMKKDWARIFVEFLKRREATDARPPSGSATADSFFGVGITGVVADIRDATVEAMGHPRTATELRHTAAQRLADAGASQEELAEFLGHSSLETSLIYFEASPTQASRLNRALALSPIYTAIVDVARTGMIDKAALLQRPPDQRVQGCPHGIPIEGIGACTRGQSLCAKNPVLSCYTCRKFLPVADGQVHRAVLGSLRAVVQLFFDASRGEAQSAAFGQLSRTLAAIEAIAEAADA